MLIKEQISPRNFYVARRKPVKSIVFDTYWKFAAERQAIFFKRLAQPLPLWSKDPIFQVYKFTNAFRASDRISQYLIRNVIYSNDFDFKNMFFRIVLFKIFNKIETWETLERTFGEISYESFDFKQYCNELLALKQKQSIYSAAYIMASGKSAYGFDSKHENHLAMLEDMMLNRVFDKIQEAGSMSNVYSELIKYPSIGSFLAYQLSIDLNYSELTNFSEMDFVKAGPGAIDGIKKCFKSLGDYSFEDIIRMMTENQEYEFDRLGLSFQNLWGRDLQLIDCQNLFCEVDKYSRIAHPEISGISGRIRIKQKYKLSTNSLKPINYYYPPKWGITTNIKNV